MAKLQLQTPFKFDSTCLLLFFGLVLFLLNSFNKVSATIIINNNEEIQQFDENWRQRRPTSSFGHEMWQQEFLLNYTNLNHGSFGACPKKVLNYQASLRLQQEQQPDVFMRTRYKQYLNDTRQQLATYINAPTDQIVLLESASTAVNSILRSFPNWKSGDVIMYFSVAYGMVKHTAQWLTKDRNITIVEIPISFPIANAKISFLKPLQEALDTLKQENKLDKLQMVILDHISSCPAILEPITDCAAMIKEYQPNAFVLVDGAHALCQVYPKLDIEALGPNIDAYLSNGHKWCFSPKGSAFLYVHPSIVTPFFPEPTVISSTNEIGDTPFVERYTYVSTREYTAWLSMSSALDFRETTCGGDEAIYEYVHALAMDAKHYLHNLWQSPMVLIDDSLEIFMFHVILPIDTPSQAIDLQKTLLENHGIYIIVIQEPSTGYIYTRLSAQIYLELSDFQKLGHLVLDYVGRKELPVEA